MASMENWDLQRYREILRKRAEKLQEDSPGRFDEEELVHRTLLNAQQAVDGPSEGATDTERIAWLARIQDNILSEKSKNGSVNQLSDSSPSTSALAEASAEEERTNKAIEHLSPTQRQVVQLRRQGHTFEEMARQLGMTKQAATGRYRRARNRLRQLLEPENLPNSNSCEVSDVPFHVLEEAVLDCAGGSLSHSDKDPPGTKVEKVVLLPRTKVNWKRAIATGPVVTLRLTIQVVPEADFQVCQRELTGLVDALIDFDQGGQSGAVGGLIIDPRETRSMEDLLILMVRPIDVRWSQDRCARMAELLNEINTFPRDNNVFSEVKLLSAHGDQTADPTQDRVLAWWRRQKWIVDLRVELVK